MRDKKLSDKDEIRVDTDAGQLLLRFNDFGLITVNMGIPKHKPADIPLLAEHFPRRSDDRNELPDEISQ